MLKHTRFTSSANEGAAFETLLAACLAAESDIRLSRSNTNTDDEYVLNALLALQKKKFLTHHKQSKLPPLITEHETIIIWTSY